MNEFLAKHRDSITGVLSCFDRIIFRGHLPFSFPKAMESFLHGQGVLLKDFKPFVLKQAQRLKEHAEALAERNGRPLHYLTHRVRKEDMARGIAARDGIEEGLVCVLSAVEPCRTFQVVRAKNRPRIEAARRKCLFLYYYWLDPKLGLLHFRIQTWFPFTVQVYLNGHEWLARQMDRAGLGYQQLDNAFVALDDPERAQRIADRFVDLNWPRLLGRLAQRFNPLLRDLVSGRGYYWVTDQAEYATDIMFADRAGLRGLYRRLVHHATLCFSAEDILTFLGKKLTSFFAGEVINEYKKRWPGARVKHQMKQNWLKMYDKHGLVLRIETVINNPYDFKIRRYGTRAGELVVGWYPMAKRVANLYRYAQISRSANHRYLAALAVVDDPTAAQQELHQLAEPTRHNGRNMPGFNPASKKDVAVFQAVLRGEHAISGFRNQDIRHKLLGRRRSKAQEQRDSAFVSRLLKRLHVHKLVAKIPRSRRWRTTALGQRVMGLVLQLHEDHFTASTMLPSPT